MEYKFKVGDRVVYSLKNGCKGISKDLIGKETILKSFDGMYFITIEGYLVKPEDIEPCNTWTPEKILEIYQPTGNLMFIDDEPFGDHRHFNPLSRDRSRRSGRVDLGVPLIHGTNTGDEWYKQQYLNQPMANKPLSEIPQGFYKISVDTYLPPVGELKGEKCNRSVEGKIYQGIIDKVYEGGCGCPSGFPPCSYCTSPTYCPICDWKSDEPEEKEINVFKFC